MRICILNAKCLPNADILPERSGFRQLSHWVSLCVANSPPKRGERIVQYIGHSFWLCYQTRGLFLPYPPYIQILKSHCRSLPEKIYTRSGPKIPAVGQLEGRAFLGLNPFCKLNISKVNKQLTISEILNFHSKHFALRYFSVRSPQELMVIK